MNNTSKQLINPTEVARAWGYTSNHDNVRKFLEKYMEASAQLAFGRGTMYLYPREAALSLMGEYKKYLAKIKDERDVRIQAVGKIAQSRLSVQRMDELESRITAIESALGMKR